MLCDACKASQDAGLISLDHCPMPIHADQNCGIDPNVDQYQLRGISGDFSDIIMGPMENGKILCNISFSIEISTGSEINADLHDGVEISLGTPVGGLKGTLGV